MSRTGSTVSPTLAPASSGEARLGRRPRGLWLALGGVALVLLAALVVVFAVFRPASEPDLSDQQVDVLLADSALNASHLELVQGASTQLDQPDGCKKLADIEEQHMVKHYNNTRPTGQSLPAQTVFLGVFDSPSSASEHFSLIGQCNTELGSTITQPATSYGKGRALVLEPKGESERLVMAQYANILVSAPQSFAGDPSNYLSVFVGAVERAARS